MVMMVSSSIAFFGNNTYDYCLKAFFEYFYTMHITGAYDWVILLAFVGNIQYMVLVLPDGTLGRDFTGMSNATSTPISPVWCFYYSFALFSIMCPISPCSTEFSAFYEHFCRFLEFLTLRFQKYFPIIHACLCLAS